MGLRERKKDRLRTALLDHAAAIVREHGADALRVGNLADRVEISEATFFNYFATKSSLVDAWARRELANAFAGLALEDRGLRPGVRAAVRALSSAIARDAKVAAALWPMARPQSLDAGEDPVAALASAFARARESAEVRRDVAAEELADLLIAAVTRALARSLASGRTTQAALEEPVLRAAELVLDGARKRHERLRVAARLGPRATL